MIWRKWKPRISIQVLAPVVQEFTPSIGGLDVIEIWTEDGSQPLTNGGGAVLQVLVRDDTIDGTILAESAPVVLPDAWNGSSRFLFTWKGRNDMRWS